ncbi:hypothetical protein LIP24_10365 [Collinsella aerofaciens]|uniref:glutaredoxin family protein n=1 Tax=Collinsella aerofaciens TaxID=74426 RepID=UPI001D034098|nr:glutaredoxin domain-containing protein [Collinsella aerofaciens]MCB5367036.1 hypothetical protein [Collinsella aerofaciens]
MKLIKLEKYHCSFCNQLGAMLDGLGVPYTAINVEDHPEVAAKYGVMAAPVLVLLDDQDNEIDRVEGFYRDKVEQLLEKFQA